jgi:hypothetical protein
VLLKRPKILTLICIFGYISALLTFPQVFSPPVKKLGALIPALYGILVALHFISCVGIWYLKKWGVQLYIMAFFAKALFAILADRTGPIFFLNLLISVAFVIVLMRFYVKLDENL